MSTDADISIAIETEGGVLYDLTTALIDFDRMRLREEKILPVVLHNRTAYSVEDITVEAVMHPTNQVGTASETYDATQLGKTEDGTWFNILQIPSMYSGQKKTVYINWTMPESAIPGVGIFAIEVKGDVKL